MARSRSRSRSQSPPSRRDNRLRHRRRSSTPPYDSRYRSRSYSRTPPRRQDDQPRSRSPRRRYHSPRQRRRDSLSPPRRRSGDYSPPRRRSSPSPPRRQDDDSPRRRYSPSPPRRSNNDQPRSRPNKNGFRWKEKPANGSQDPNSDRRLERGYRERDPPCRRSPPPPAPINGHNEHAAEEPRKEKKKKAPAAPTIAPVGQPMIIVNVNDRLGTKAAIPCLASDPISMSPFPFPSFFQFPSYHFARILPLHVSSPFNHNLITNPLTHQNSSKPKLPCASVVSRTRSC